MKIKAVVNICKRTGRMEMYYDEEKQLQYMGNGCAFYPLNNMPVFNESNVFTAFDITAKQQEKIFYAEPQTTGIISLDDIIDGESPVEIESMGISVAGCTFLPIKTSQGLLFIDAKYLEPLADVMDSLLFYERINQSGESYIVAKNGFIFAGAIAPFKLITKEFTKQLEELTQRCKIAFSNQSYDGE